MQWVSLPFRRPDLLAVLAAGVLWLLNAGATLAATNTPPGITRQPVSGVAAEGEDFAFSVEAAGTLPLSYQWVFFATNLPGATNSSLLLTNLTRAQQGFYAAVVTNIAGSVTSSPVLLNLQTAFPRRLAVGRILFGKIPQVAVPIVMRANGVENTVTFSLAYKTNTLLNPVFLPGYPAASVTTDAGQPGLFGVSIALPPGTAFTPGYTTVGLVRFDVYPAENPLDGALAFTNNPLPVSAINGAQQALSISASVPPQFVLVTSAPALDRQSGLFKQQLIVYNPGADIMTNVNVLPLTLGEDSQTNKISFYNRLAFLTNFPYSDPLVGISCGCDCGYALDSPTTECDFASYVECATGGSCALDSAVTNIDLAFAQIYFLAPGEARRLTMEYYVPDHHTAPPATYSVYLADQPNFTFPTNFATLTITTNRYVNGTFLIEFPTQLGDLYYVEYDLTPDFTNSLVAFPSIQGTGSRVQWIDDGPPKTISPPVNGSRFYRVLQTK
jgi:hypothetical protein